MKSFNFPGCLALAVLCLGAGCGGQQSNETPTIETAIVDTNKNVVVVLIDTLRADRLHGERNGVPIMPYLSDLANRSAQFDRAHAPSSWTKVSMASIFTSLYVDWHQVRYSALLDDPENPQSDILSDAHETMATYFKAHGYGTYGVQTNGNVTADLGFAQGFDAYTYLPGMPARSISDEGRKLLESHDNADPFMLFLQYFDPHTPYNPPQEFFDRFGPGPELKGADLKYTGIEFKSYFWDVVNTILGRQEAREIPNLSPEAEELIRQRYDAECAYVDDEIRLLLEPIFRKHPETVVVVLSDHGEEFWEHGGMGHGYNLFDPQTRIPLFFYGPGIETARYDKSVNAIGTLPTLAAQLGLPAREHWQGTNLLDPAQQRGEVYLRTYGSWPKDDVNATAIARWPWKYIRDDSEAPQYGLKMLFNRETDPLEQHNLADTHPEQVEAFEALIEDFETAWGEAPSMDQNVRSEMSPEHIQELEAMGYLGGMSEELESGAAETAEDDAPEPEAKAPHNLMLVIIDTLRADRIAGKRNDMPIMPQLAQFAEEAWNFEQCMAQASWTKPSVASILTGLYTETHKVRFGIQAKWLENQQMLVEVIPDAIPTMDRLFQENGYATAGIQTNQHLQQAYGFGAGCASYSNMPWAPANAVTDAAIASASKMDDPFFLYVHYFDPHATYDPPEPHRSAFGPLPPLSDADRNLLTDKNYHEGYYLDQLLHLLGLKEERDYGQMSEAGRDHVRQLYDGECRFVDAELGRLLDWIDTEHPDTVVVITSDHGEEFWEHGGIGHARTVYQEVVHVPLIVRIPGEAPRVIPTPVETIDILPTVAAAVGFEQHAWWQGRNLITAHADDLEARPVYSQTRSSIPEANLCLETVREGNDKLIVNRRSGERELYQLAEDPQEQRNRINESGDRATELEKLLTTHNRAVREHPAAQHGPQQVPLDESVFADLEALGYVGGAGIDTLPALEDSCPEPS